MLKYTPFLKVQSYTFDADFLKNKERVYGYTSLPVSATVTSTANYFFPYQISRQFKFTTTTMVYLLVAPTWTGTANALAYDATCAFSIMRIA